MSETTESYGPVIGIDLGTSNSLVAAVVDGEPVLIRDADGRVVVPSVLAVLPGEEHPIVGTRARNLHVIDPGRTISSVKRLIGRRADDTAVARIAEEVGFEVIAADDDWPQIAIGDATFEVVEVLAIILGRLRTIAEEFLGERINRAVITVPASFNQAQRRATRMAGTLAGLDVMRLLNEPTAAALAYGVTTDSHETVAVYDLGGGTFDLTLLELRAQVFEVRATDGDSFLGGDDIDRLVARELADRIQTRFGVEVPPIGMQRLKTVAERMKMDLSEVTETEGQVPAHWLGIIDRDEIFTVELERDTLEEMCHELIDRTFECCTRALAAASLRPESVDSVVLVGGSTRMPLIRERVAHFFGREPEQAINPETVVCIGAALHADTLDSVRRPRFEGARPSTLIDVCQHTLSIGTVGGFVEPVVPANTPLPVRRTRHFSTTRDNQDTVRLKIFEGGSKLAAQNHELGELILNDIRPMQRGAVTIATTFEVTTDGVLQITAVDVGTGQAQSSRLVVNNNS